MTLASNSPDRPDPDSPAPGVSVAQIQRMMAAELSLRTRVGYVALLLAALAMAVMVGSLWLTEPSLPLRAQVAFALIVGIALSWVAHAGRVLTSRRVLLAAHQVVAARMAVGFSLVFVAGMIAIALWDSGRAASVASVAAPSGTVMLAAALFLLVRARRRYAYLQERRVTLEAALAGRRQGA
jgi:hypothetical protein